MADLPTEKSLCLLLILETFVIFALNEKTL